MTFDNDRITQNFRLSEFACGQHYYCSPEFICFVVDVLQPFRSWYNRPININSGYRTAAHNRAVGGDTNSLHLTAMAIDFNLPAEYRSFGYDRRREFIANIKVKWFDLCRKSGAYGQMTVHNGWLHLGMSRNREYYSDRR